MIEKRPVGITVIAIFGVVLGFSALLSHISDIHSYCKGTLILGRYSPIWLFQLKEILGIAVSLGAIISSFFILKLKYWARRLFIYLILVDSISVLVSVIIITTIMPYAKYGILRVMDGYVLEIFSSLHFIANFSEFSFRYIPDAYLEIVTWFQFYLSIGLIIFFLLYLSRASVKEKFGCQGRSPK